jgi:hypothetical protein
MKNLALTLSLVFFLGIGTQAQKPFKVTSAKIGAYFGPGRPLGDLASDSAFGRAGAGLFGGFWLDWPILRKRALLSAGATFFSPPIEGMDAERAFSVALDPERYFVNRRERKDGFYDAGLFSIGLKAPIPVERFSLEPCVSVGYAHFRMVYWVNYNAKERGSNYARQVSVDSGLSHTGSFGWRAGLRLQCYLTSWMGLGIGPEVMGLAGRETFTKTSTDLLGAHSREEIPLTLKFRAWGLHLGLFVRLRS